MASTLTAKTMKVTIKEDITLNGVQQGDENILSIASIVSIHNQFIPVPTSEVTILSFGTAVAGATFVVGDVRYIRITNLDGSNYVRLIIADENNGESVHKLSAGRSMVISVDGTNGVANVHDADAAAITSFAICDIASITALANSAECDIQVYVASA